MELRQFIRTDIAASAVAHLSVLALVFLFAEVHPFGVVTAEPIAVDLVTPDEVPAREPDPPPPPAQTPSLDALSQAKSEAANAPQPSKPPGQQPANPPPQQQAAPSPPRSNRKEVAAVQLQPQPPSPAPSPPPAQAAAPAPAYTPPEPDLTLKYHVMLGLPEDLRLSAKPAGSGDKSGDGIDATASTAADVASGVVAEFRATSRHARNCRLRLGRPTL
jgi:outer membrane biosynthesis protein TonB